MKIKVSQKIQEGKSIIKRNISVNLQNYATSKETEIMLNIAKSLLKVFE